MRGLASTLLCRVFGHEWELREGAIPEDRDTYKCARCEEWGFYPANCLETEVPPGRRAEP